MHSIYEVMLKLYNIIGEGGGVVNNQKIILIKSLHEKTDD